MLTQLEAIPRIQAPRAKGQRGAGAEGIAFYLLREKFDSGVFVLVLAPLCRQIRAWLYITADYTPTAISLSTIGLVCFLPFRLFWEKADPVAFEIEFNLAERAVSVFGNIKYVILNIIVLFPPQKHYNVRILLYGS